MRSAGIILVLLGIGIGAGAYAWWNWNGPRPPAMGVAAATQPTTQPVIRLGLVPEHDPFALRRSYGRMAEYLSKRLGRRVELVTLNTYEAVLLDFRDRHIDGAFLGSLVALLAIDRFDARVLVKPEQEDGVSTYRGVIFVREDAPIRALADLRSGSIAMLRATAAGCLFPLAEMVRHGMLEGEKAPRIVWMGTHDQVIEAVMTGRAEAGAVKDLRLIAFLKAHPEARIRQLAASSAVPNNALVMRADLENTLGVQVAELLKGMEQDPEGRAALQSLGARRFIPCRREEYEAVYEMAEPLGTAWKLVGVSGEPPRRPNGNLKK